MTASAVLKEIRRHPVKSVGGETLPEVGLTAGEALPGDRLWAVLHAAAARHVSTGGATDWLPKSAFLRGAAAPALQAVEVGWRDGKLALRHPEHPDLVIDPEDPSDAAVLIDWLRPLWPEDKPAPARLVRGTQALTDTRAPVISVLSLDSLRALEAACGQCFDTRRWRGNLWLEGWPARFEATLSGRRLAIGPVRLHVVEPIGRCTATNANSATGVPDCDMLAALRHAFGDTCFGVFALVETGGLIRPGDRVEVLP